MIAKTGRVWSTTPPNTNIRRGAENIVRVRASSKSEESVQDCFELFLSEDMVRGIVHWTNEK